MRSGRSGRSGGNGRRTHEGPDGPWIGAAGRRPLARFSHDERLDRLLLELQEGFGPQRWWPAETPFEVVVGAVLVQNTTWRNVELALAELRRRVELAPEALLALGESELARAVRSSGSYNVKAARLRAVSGWLVALGGPRALAQQAPEPLRASLLEVRGVGPETADAILCYAAGRPMPVVDAYAERILVRHGLVPAGTSRAALRAWLLARLLPSQVVMEEFHALCVRAGSAHCGPEARCQACPATTPVPSPGATLASTSNPSPPGP